MAVLKAETCRSNTVCIIYSHTLVSIFNFDIVSKFLAHGYRSFEVELLGS